VSPGSIERKRKPEIIKGHVSLFIKLSSNSKHHQQQSLTYILFRAFLPALFFCLTLRGAFCLSSFASFASLSSSSSFSVKKKKKA
jgi:hypothetical protein